MKFGKYTVHWSKETLIHKGEHFFHSSYLAAETFLGHGPLQYLAGGSLLIVILSIVLHVQEAGH